MQLRPYQEEGVRWLSKSQRKTQLLADAPGLGKSAQALSAANAIKATSLLIIAPASVTGVWERECAAWLTIAGKVSILGSEFKVTRITITSYDRAVSHYDKLKDVGFEMVVADEGHMIKTPTAKRTKAVINLLYRAKRKALVLTGTPVVNRPIEIFGLLRNLAPDVIDGMTLTQFGNRYCGPTLDWNGNPEYKGSCNEGELGDRLRKSGFMLRRSKAEVLAELPDKQYRIVPVAAAASTAEHLSTNLAELGLEKAAGSYSYISDLLAGGVEKVVIFAKHTDVIRELERLLHWAHPVVIDGAVPQQHRTERVKTFQEDPQCRAFIGQIHAAGTGLTLTAACDVVMVETDWAPGMNTQCEDRCHRFGQKNAVTIHYMISNEDTIDSVVSRVVASKESKISAIMDEKEIW